LKKNKKILFLNFFNWWKWTIWTKWICSMWKKTRRKKRLFKSRLMGLRG